MGMGGDAPKVVAILWALAGLILVWVLLRVYTRAVVIRSFGCDDHVFNLAFLLYLLFATFITISAQYGFGQDISSIPPSDLDHAMLYQMIAQTSLVIAMALAKWSLGIFLLRLVVEIWHKVVIWVTMLAVMAGCVVCVFVLWLGCSPPQFRWDMDIPGGKCGFSMLPAAYVSTCLLVAADFIFAILPWLFIWKLNMKRRDKLTILLSLSLGVIAGVFGIKRTIAIESLESPNYPKDTVPLMIWAGAEIAVTMVCIGIAVCRPLYKRIYTRLSDSHEHRSPDSDPPTDKPERHPPEADADLGIPALPRHHLGVHDDKTVPRSCFAGITESRKKTGRLRDGDPSNKDSAGDTRAQDAEVSWV